MEIEIRHRSYTELRQKVLELTMETVQLRVEIRELRKKLGIVTKGERT